MGTLVATTVDERQVAKTAAVPTMYVFAGEKYIIRVN
jgi:hypothetical protein